MRIIKSEPYYRGYSIRYTSYHSMDVGFEAFAGFTPVFQCTFPTINRCKVAIDLWWKFHMNPPKFWELARHLFVTNRYNYSGCYGKLKLVKELKKLSKRKR